MFHPDDPLVLRAEGLEKPRKKRGRPKKAQSEPDILTDNSTSNTGYSEIAPVDSENKRDDKHDKDEDPDGRRRRKRKVPQRYTIRCSCCYSTYPPLSNCRMNHPSSWKRAISAQ